MLIVYAGQFLIYCNTISKVIRDFSSWRIRHLGKKHHIGKSDVVQLLIPWQPGRKQKGTRGKGGFSSFLRGMLSFSSFSLNSTYEPFSTFQQQHTGDQPSPQGPLGESYPNYSTPLLNFLLCLLCACFFKGFKNHSLIQESSQNHSGNPDGFVKCFR